MVGMIRDSRVGRCILAMLFALVLAVRVAIPTGYMPTSAPQGIVISVCTGMGQAKAFLPTSDGKSDHDGSTTADGACTFAAGLGGGLLAATSVTAQIAIAQAIDTPASRAIPDLTVHRFAAPPPPSQGPPARA